MARNRAKRGMGRLLKELRTSPIAAVINGVLGLGGMLSAGLVLVRRFTRSVKAAAPGPSAERGTMIISLFITAFLVLGGIAFLLFALLQWQTRLCIYERGLAWYRFGKKRIVLWVEVEHFGRGDDQGPQMGMWSLLLRSGERIDLRSTFYHRRQFEAAMELITEQIEEVHREYG